MSPSAVAAVGIGAALGAWARWALGVALNATVPNLPLGTLAANLIGGYLIGVAVAWFEAHGASPELRLLVTTGFLGGLTTFSAFSGEATALLTPGAMAGRRSTSAHISAARSSRRSPGSKPSADSASRRPRARARAARAGRF